MSEAICPCGSMGALSEIAVIDGETVERYDFVAENLELHEWIVGDQGLTGNLDLFADHMRRSSAYVSGSLMMNVSARELENWLPRILRGEKTGETHFPGELSPSFDIIVKRDKATFRYNGLQVDKALFRASSTSQEPGLVEMMLSFIGIDEVKGEWPEPPPERVRDNLLYWLIADSTLTLDSDEYHMEAFNFYLDNMLLPLMRNSLRPVCIRSEGRRIRFQSRIPLCEESADNLHFDGFDGAGVLLFESAKNLDNSDSETRFDFGRLFGRKVSPGTAGRTETFLTVDLGSYPGADEDLEPSLKVSNKFPS